jgi:hypothetical protein
MLVLDASADDSKVAEVRWVRPWTTFLIMAFLTVKEFLWTFFSPTAETSAGSLRGGELVGPSQNQAHERLGGAVA